MNEIRPRRSVLYMPGSNARAMEKARTLPADALILDLEDAVAPEAKEQARAQVCAAVKAGFGRREVVVRINALRRAWGEQDLTAVAAAGARRDTGAESVFAPQEIHAVAARLSTCRRQASRSGPWWKRRARYSTSRALPARAGGSPAW